MDAPTKALARLGLTSLDLPRLDCDSSSKSDSADSGLAESSRVDGASAGDSGATSCAFGATSTSSECADIASEDGSQDSLAVEVDAEVPSSMSSMDDDDDEYDIEDDDLFHRHTDDR